MKLILVRHGQSIWNLENRFTGWTDVGLTEQGVAEAHNAARLLKEENISIDLAYTSVLKRANDTLDIILNDLNIKVPTAYSWRLNERHYGALQGLNKKETADKYGDEQVHTWRRSADVRPPQLDWEDKRHPRFDDKYQSLTKDELTAGECLLDTVARVMPYFESEIKPALLNNNNIIISAHGNSLRGLIKELEDLTDEEIVKVELQTGVPIIYDLDDNLKIISKKILQ